MCRMEIGEEMMVDKPMVDMDDVVTGIVDLAVSRFIERDEDINIDTNDNEAGEVDEIVVDEKEKFESGEEETDSEESSTDSDDSDDTEDFETDESFEAVMYSLEDLVGDKKGEEMSKDIERKDLENGRVDEIKEVKSSLTENERKAKVNEILERRGKSREMAVKKAMVEDEDAGDSARISKEYKKPFEPKLIEWKDETMKRTTRMSLEKSTSPDFGKKVKSQVVKVDDKTPNKFGGRTFTNKSSSYDLYDKNSNLRRFGRTPAENLNIESNVKESSIMDCVRKEVEKQKVVKTLGDHSLKETVSEMLDDDDEEMGQSVTLADFLKGPAHKRLRSDNFGTPSAGQERTVIEREKVYMISTGAGSVDATRVPSGDSFDRVRKNIKEIRDSNSYNEVEHILKQMVVNAVGTDDLEKLEDDVGVTFVFGFNITKDNKRGGVYKPSY